MMRGKHTLPMLALGFTPYVCFAAYVFCEWLLERGGLPGIVSGFVIPCVVMASVLIGGGVMFLTMFLAPMFPVFVLLEYMGWAGD